LSGLSRFTEHIDELRRRLKVVLISLVVAVLLVLLLPLDPRQLLSLNTVFYTTPVSVFLKNVVTQTLPSGWALIPLTVGSPLEVFIYASLILGLSIDMPVIVFEAYRFIDPALKDEERKMVYPVVLSATGLFIVGLLFGYFLLARFIFVAMGPFYSAIGISPPYYIAASDFYSVIFLSVLFSGLAFLTPVFAYILIRFGILTPRFFSKNRLYIWGGTYIVTAIITPDGGPVLDVMLFVPVVILLELSVFLGGRYVKRRNLAGGPACGYCGAAVSEREGFCPSCGRALA
jgi:sec-independent protein translocase protein TatC